MATLAPRHPVVTRLSAVAPAPKREQLLLKDTLRWEARFPLLRLIDIPYPPLPSLPVICIFPGLIFLGSRHPLHVDPRRKCLLKPPLTSRPGAVISLKQVPRLRCEVMVDTPALLIRIQNPHPLKLGCRLLPLPQIPNPPMATELLGFVTLTGTWKVLLDIPGTNPAGQQCLTSRGIATLPPRQVVRLVVLTPRGPSRRLLTPVAKH